MKTLRTLKNCASNRIFPLLLFALLAGSAPSATAAIQVNTIGGGIIGLYFDHTVTVPSANNTDNYTIYTKGLPLGVTVSVTNAVLQSDNQTVALYLSTNVGEFFAVSVTNVFDAASNNISANATGYRTLGLNNTSIGIQGDPNPLGTVISPFQDTFSVTASGSDIGSTNGFTAGTGSSDHCHFVFQFVAGNFDMNVLVNRLDNTDPGSKAGLMAREYLAPGSRSLQTLFTPVSSLGTNELLTTIRFVTNGVVSSAGVPPLSNISPTWLRMTRVNNTFTTYYGSNGITWTTNNSTSLTWNGGLFVGTAVTSHTNGATTTAGFTSFGVLNPQQGVGATPTLTASIYQKTNLVAKWFRTPNDFTVQVGFNLMDTNNSTGSISNATQWAYLMSPVYDTALTGTNAAMPTQGRYMIIPLSLFSKDQVFVRLAQVDRVIPDPPGVTAGTIFSQGSGGAFAPASLNALCGATIVTTNAVASTGIPIVCPNSPAGKYTYQFTTEPSGSSYNTIISVRAYTAVGASNCDILFTAGGGKSQVQVTPTPSATLTNYGYTFVAAPTTPAPACNPVKVRVNIITNF